MAEKRPFWQRLIKGLTKTRDNFIKSMDYIFNGFTNIDEDFYEELEEVLIMGDIGVRTTETIIDDLKDAVKKEHIKEPAECKEFLINEIKEQMSLDETSYDFEKKTSVVLVIGVNGVGKTTTIGKLAYQFKKRGLKVMLGAADTFRAAAIEQLQEWGRRVDVPVIRQEMGSDPASVAYDTLSSAVANDIDVVLIDTAGRLHNKVGLMNELTKIRNVMNKVVEGAPDDVLLVLDGSTGQNAFEQAKQFTLATQVTQLAITKLDGTAKGGVVIGISDQFKVPVKYVGLGEAMDNLQVFNKTEFVDSLFKMD